MEVGIGLFMQTKGKLKEKLNRGGMCVGLLGRLKGMLWHAKKPALNENMPWPEDKDQINWTEGPERYHRNGVLVICRIKFIASFSIARILRKAKKLAGRGIESGSRRNFTSSQRVACTPWLAVFSKPLPRV
jgi:hypothetical protein